MKSIKRFLGIVLSVSVILSCSLAFGSAAGKCGRKYKNEYPFVFVHGFNGWGEAEGINGIAPYWGGTTGDLMAYLRKEGYECYSASVGPISSAWDRACELYAQLTGTTVDYGEAHSREHSHLRYGRTYEKPLFEGWSAGKKINLIGHSFGGTTIRLLTHLLTYGCEEEVKAAGKSVSGLFTGGKQNLVKSVTTICTPHNSATVYRLTKETALFEIMQAVSGVYCGSVGRSPLNGRLVDFHLEQFGLTNTPGKYDADLYIKSVIEFAMRTDDLCEYDLAPEGAAKLNDFIKISPDVYYFSYAFDATRVSPLTGLYWPEITANPVIAPIGVWTGHIHGYTEESTGQVYDDSWHANDMLCSTVSETYPFTEPHRQYSESGRTPKGIWNVMPVQRGDHGQAVGLLADRKELRGFYLGLAEMLTGLK